MEESVTNGDPVTSIVQEEEHLDRSSVPPGVIEAIELYDASIQHYAEAIESYEPPEVVVSTSSAVSPW
jgi:hypothetical protein